MAVKDPHPALSQGERDRGVGFSQGVSPLLDADLDIETIDHGVGFSQGVRA